MRRRAGDRPRAISSARRAWRPRRRAGGARLRVALAFGACALAGAGALAASAFAYLHASGTGTIEARAATLTVPAKAAARVVGGNVEVSWDASTIAGSIGASSYTVERYREGGEDLGPASCGTVLASEGVGGELGSFSCTDSPGAGTFEYRITAHYRTWSAQSKPTAALTVRTSQTRLSSAPNPSLVGQQVTYKATVAVEPAGTPGGKVEFREDEAPISGCAEQVLSATSPYEASCTVTYDARGSHKVTARYLGDGSYPPSTSAAITQVVDLAGQAITFESLAQRRLDQSPFRLSATASSGLPVSFRSLSEGVCTVAGSSVTLLTTGTCTIEATQEGNDEWAAATPVRQEFRVTKGEQTISFAKPRDRSLSESPFSLSASASSGLEVRFVSKSATVCSVSGASVTLLATGTCEIEATQEGDTSWEAATAVLRSFAVTADRGELRALSAGTVAAREGAARVAVSPDGLNVYVTNRETGPGVISQYARSPETGALTPLATSTTSTGDEPEGIAVSPDGKFVYVANKGVGTVTWYTRETANGGELARRGSIGAGSHPIGLAISPDGNNVYVANAGSKSVSEYSRNPTSGVLTPLATISAGPMVHGIAVSPDGKNVYAINYGAGTVSQYARNSGTGELSELPKPTVLAGENPHDLAISPDGNDVYVANSVEHGEIAQFSRGAGGALTPLGSESIAAGRYTECVAVSSDGENVYATNYGSGTISEYRRNALTGELFGLLPDESIATGKEPEGIALASKLGGPADSVYATNYGSGSVSQYERLP